MTLATWWKKRRVERKLPAQRQRYIRPMLEELESRLVPSVTGFSTVTEVGNNAADPTQGTAGTDLLRLSPVAYANGISTPSLPGNGATTTTPPVPIASPRTISNDVFNQSPTLFGSPATDINTVDGNGLSDFGYSFGQFMDHDMDLTPDQTGQPVPSPNPNKDGNDGFPIPADKTNPGDPIGSLAFSRSVFDPTTGTSEPAPADQRGHLLPRPVAGLWLDPGGGRRPPHRHRRLAEDQPRQHAALQQLNVLFPDCVRS